MSSSYNEEVLNAAGDSVAIGHRLTNQRIAIAVFDSLERAPWWEEVEVGYEFMPDEPYRNESPDGIASEHTATHTFTVLPVLKNTYFRDTRWTPPPAPLAIGDVIETVEDLERLPVGAGVVDYREEIALKRCEQRWNYANLSSESCGSESVMGLAPITVVYLPKTEATEIINATKKAAKTKEEMA